VWFGFGNVIDWITPLTQLSTRGMPFAEHAETRPSTPIVNSAVTVPVRSGCEPSSRA
jgi:hypothetical protein